MDGLNTMKDFSTVSSSGFRTPVKGTADRRPAHPKYYWHLKEGHLKDELQKSGQSGIEVEKIRAVGDTGATIIPNFATAIIVMARSQLTGSKVLMSGLTFSKGDALNRGNYQDLKLIKQAMKILDPWRQNISIDDSHFSFSPGRGATDALMQYLWSSSCRRNT